VRDLDAGVTERVSVATDGEENTGIQSEIAATTSRRRAVRRLRHPDDEPADGGEFSH
jgi:hypothetical protein